MYKIKHIIYDNDKIDSGKELNSKFVLIKWGSEDKIMAYIFKKLADSYDTLTTLEKKNLFLGTNYLKPNISDLSALGEHGLPCIFR